VINMSGYEELVKAIVDEMKKIIGPVAVTQANLVDGLEFKDKVVIKGKPELVVAGLVNRYKSLVGPVAWTIAKKGVKKALEKNPRLKVPKELM